MGAEQSSSRANGAAGGNAAAPRKTCYYEVMGLDRSATDDEIRKAYKRKALELHPDRNINDVENSTRKFAEVQTAYEVLSDPQERAWYDSHREAILSGDDSTGGGGPGGGPPSSLDITTVDEIYALMGRFTSAVRFDDSPNGFFATLDVFFGKLAAEETAACEWDALAPVAYPPFGSSADDYDAVARPFYNAWSAFSTRKSFSWCDRYRLSDAADRRVRRLMEKENKKFRDEGIRDFNDAVRSLAAFVKKRDPRYVPNTQSEAERQKVLRDSAAAQAARSRAANQEKLAEYVLPEWAQARNDDEGGQSGEFSESDDDESEVEHIECVVCAKTFKSEMQFQAHERSKKHVKAVQQIRRQMKKENKDFDLDLDRGHREEKQQSDAELSTSSAEAADAGAEEAPAAPPAKEGQQAQRPNDNSSEEDSLDDDYAPREKIQSRIGGDAPGDAASFSDEASSPLAATPSIAAPPPAGDLDAEDEPAKTKKVGKAKQKKAKKAARQAASAEQASVHACTICKDSFASRNALFAHLTEEHPAPKSAKGAKKSKR
ncbi:hypothetical protein RB595_007082 [Gaeumannomyces hyphopodioides]